MVVGATADDVVTLVHEGSGHESGVLAHLHDVLHVLVAEGFAEGNGLGGDDVLQGTALDAREHGAVDQGRHHLRLALRGLAAARVFEVMTDEDHAATGTAEGLVGRGGDDVAVLQRNAKRKTLYH